MTGRVWVVGSLNVDLVCRVERHPVPGETVLGRELVRLPGGKGANQALGAAGAGAEVTLVAAVGDDDSGRAYVRALGDRGVRTSVRQVGGSATGHALITVDDRGENTIVVAQGANAELDAGWVTEHLREVAAGDVLLAQLEIPMDTVVAAARAARSAGAVVVLNPSPWQELPAELVELVDVLVVNATEAGALGELPPSTSVCRTLGADGAQWDGDEVGGDDVGAVDVVDTTGAGDAFAGALAAGLAAGRPRRDVLAAAVSAGGRACTHRGAQPWAL